MAITYYYLPKVNHAEAEIRLADQRSVTRKFLGYDPQHEIIRIGSGNREGWPKLRHAIELARQTGSRLVIASLDRVRCNTAFLQILAEAETDFAVADMPHITREAVNDLLRSARAGSEARSRRTKAALARARTQGVRLGGNRGNLHVVGAAGRERSIISRRAAAEKQAKQALPYVEAARNAGRESFSQIAAYLNLQGLRTARGRLWTKQAVHKLLRSHEGKCRKSGARALRRLESLPRQ